MTIVTTHIQQMLCQAVDLAADASNPDNTNELAIEHLQAAAILAEHAAKELLTEAWNNNPNTTIKLY